MLNWGCSDLKKTELNEKVAATKDTVKHALQTMYDTLNHGQQQKIVKDEKVKALFDRYGVEY